MLDCSARLLRASHRLHLDAGSSRRGCQGRQFSIGWGTGGEKILFYLGIWTVALVFYSTQSLCMASFAERLNLNLRNRLAAKLNRLPLKFYDGHKPVRL